MPDTNFYRTGAADLHARTTRVSRGHRLPAACTGLGIDAELHDGPHTRPAMLKIDLQRAPRRGMFAPAPSLTATDLGGCLRGPAQGIISPEWQQRLARLQNIVFPKRSLTFQLHVDCRRHGIKPRFLDHPRHVQLHQYGNLYFQSRKKTLPAQP